MSSPRSARPWLLRWPGLLLALVVVLSYHGSEGDFSELFSPGARKTLADFARGFWPPAHSPEFLSQMLRPLLETVAIAVLGISLAVVLALPLSVLATSPFTLSPLSRPGPARRLVQGAARLLL